MNGNDNIANQKKLIENMIRYPDLPVVPMVDGAIANGNDQGRWMGSFGNSFVDEYIIDIWSGNGCVRYKSDGDDETLINAIARNRYGDCSIENRENAARDLNSMWQKAIILNINCAE